MGSSGSSLSIDCELPVRGVAADEVGGCLLGMGSPPYWVMKFSEKMQTNEGPSEENVGSYGRERSIDNQQGDEGEDSEDQGNGGIVLHRLNGVLLELGPEIFQPVANLLEEVLKVR